MRVKFRYGIAALLISAFLVWEVFYHNKPYVYYIGFGIETFTAVTPETFSQHSGAKYITVAELAAIKRSVLNGKAKSGRFIRERTRFLGINNGRTEILIDADGGFEIGDHCGRLYEADKEIVQKTIGRILSRHHQRLQGI